MNDCVTKKNILDAALAAQPSPYDMPNAPVSGLSLAEAERLDVLIEEASEVIHIASKIKRHGYDSGNPETPIADRQSNRELLEKELGHFLNSLRMMADTNDVCLQTIGSHQAHKAAHASPYLHYQGAAEDYPVTYSGVNLNECLADQNSE